MCIPTKLQQNIIDRTKEGDAIAKFLFDTMQGQHTDAKFNHRLEAAKHLIRYGFPNAECETAADRLSRAGGNPEGQGEDETPVQSPLSPGERARACPELAEGVRGEEIAAPVTHLDILNYEIAHLIRHETAEGHTLVEFLIHTMTGRDRPFTPKKFCIKPADRMAAARELLRRGFGDLGSRRKQSDGNDESNTYDTLHTDLAKRMREYSERGTDTVRFLLEVMSDPNPEEEFTIHHRMSAAQELLRRGWDTNYDNIRPEHLTDYWRDKESSCLSIGQKKTLSGLSTSIDDYDNYDDTDYEAIAKEIREEEDRDVNSKLLRFQETVPSSRHSSESRNLEDLQAASPATKLPLPQGEGWGEGKETNAPSTPTLPKSLPQSKSENEPTADRKSIIKEFKEAMDKGDERAALRAEAKYRRIDVKPEKNIYDYGPNDPDPTVDYYFEPLSTEEQAKFDKEDRREHGLTEEEIAEYSAISTPEGKSDPLSAACRSRRHPQHAHPPQPARRQAQKPHHPQPISHPAGPVRLCQLHSPDSFGITSGVRRLAAAKHSAQSLPQCYNCRTCSQALQGTTATRRQTIDRRTSRLPRSRIWRIHCISSLGHATRRSGSGGR